MSRLEVQSKPVSFEAPDNDIEALDEICEQEGKSRSEKLRELVADEVASHQADDTDPRLPESERLRDAYFRLRRHANEIEGFGLRITLSEAQNRLYDTQTPKDAVKDELITPLVQQNLAAVDPALDHVWIVVNPLDDDPSEPTAQTTSQPAVQEASD